VCPFPPSIYYFLRERYLHLRIKQVSCAPTKLHFSVIISIVPPKQIWGFCFVKVVSLLALTHPMSAPPHTCISETTRKRNQCLFLILIKVRYTQVILLFFMIISAIQHKLIRGFCFVVVWSFPCSHWHIICRYKRKQLNEAIPYHDFLLLQISKVNRSQK